MLDDALGPLSGGLQNISHGLDVATTYCIQLQKRDDLF